MKKIMILGALLTALWITGAVSAPKNQRNFSDEEARGLIKCVGPYNRDYFIKLPDHFDPAKTYWLAIGCHGAGSKGTRGVRNMAEGFRYSEDCIIVGPSFPEGPEEGGYYQTLEGNADKQLLEIVNRLNQEYKLHDRFFIFGFSGGAQFSHRFAMKYPGSLLGCSAHSAGTWDPPSLSAKYLPFDVSCGGNDTAKSVPDARMTRLEWYRDFSGALRKGGFCFKGYVEEGQGHKPGPRVAESKNQLFALTTTGLFPSQKAPLDLAVKEIRALIAKKKLDEGRRAIRDLASFTPPPVEYKEAPVDDIPGAPHSSGNNVINEYGFTTCAAAEKYLKERHLYYLRNVVIKELEASLSTASK